MANTAAFSSLVILHGCFPLEASALIEAGVPINSFKHETNELSHTKTGLKIFVAVNSKASLAPT